MSSSEPVGMAKRLIISAIESSGEDNPKKTDFHKIIYRLQETVKQDDLENKLGGQVPYYWYEEGPYSEVIEKAREDLLEEGKIQEEKSQGGVKIYRLEEDVDSELEEALKIAMESICSNYNFYALNQEIESIYENFAPIKFQRYYKFSFLPYLKNTVQQIESSQSGLAEHYDISDRRYSKLKTRLIKSHACLPRGEEYEEFNAIFGRFFDAAKLHIKMLENDEQIEGAETLANLSEEMWELFAKFIRIAHHDPYYEHKVEGWKEVRDNTLEGKKAQVEHYESLIYTQENSVLQQDYKSDSNSAWGAVAKGIVNRTG